MSIYNPAIPEATDLISTSQGEIKDNFDQLNLQFQIDHIAFNTGSGNGNGHHKQVTFDNAPTAPTLSGTMSAIFAHLVAGKQQLAFANATTTYPLTGIPLVTGTSGATGSGILTPWGIILNWGQKTFSGASQAILWQVPFTSADINVFVTINDSTPSAVSVSGSSMTGTTIYKAQTANRAVFFFAIGH